ncbi:MAG: amidohydrolase [Sinobacteraceae bacterium]|nr:amidohydrolase [Nevskiaceae bacterium]
MEVIDAQVHSWETQTTRGWDSAYDALGTDPNNGYTVELALSAMDAVGVNAAVLSLPPSYRTLLPDGRFRYDNSYAEEMSLKYPDRIASAARYRVDDPEIEALVAATRSRPGTLCVRCVIRLEDEIAQYKAGVHQRLLTACERHQVPLMLFVSGRPEEAEPIARNFPDLQIIIDHLGLEQPPYGKPTAEPWAKLPSVLALAKYPNVALKFSGAPSLSRESYPFLDLWPHLCRVIDAFGPDRLMWGSDVTRVRGLHTYAESLFYLLHSERLSRSDKQKILGATLRRLLRWQARA